MESNQKLILSLFLLLCIGFSAYAQQFIEVARFKAAAAKQAVAVDDKYFYAIDNTTIVKYDMNGDSVGAWVNTVDNPLKHINSGIVVGNKLYCAHSNYPDIPMASSIEIFDTKTMRHEKTISFGIETGSCTWVLPGRNCWYVFFAHYENRSQQPNRDVSWSQLVKYNKDWTKIEAWVLPKDLLPRVRPYSLSGGVLIDDVFYCTGHDAKECYLLKIPDKGYALEWIGTVPIPFEGQGIAVDEEQNLWGISRKVREVIKSEYK